jgi:hypothetical protein
MMTVMATVSFGHRKEGVLLRQLPMDGTLYNTQVADVVALAPRRHDDFQYLVYPPSVFAALSLPWLCEFPGPAFI